MERMENWDTKNISSLHWNIQYDTAIPTMHCKRKVNLLMSKGESEKKTLFYNL